MLVLKNEIPIRNNFTEVDFICKVFDWITKSPHSSLSALISQLKPTEKTFEICSLDKKEQLISKYFTDGNNNISGIQYVRNEQRNIWTTSFVMPPVCQGRHYVESSKNWNLIF